ncbi:MAG: hypothetical protein PHW53_05005 [Patescibacteria group bacterium]|nr:hypothetical protein [Patescibacteria group bacterium]
MKFRCEAIFTSFHLSAYADHIHPARGEPYLFHALVVPVEGGGCFLYGLDKTLTRADYLSLFAELKAMHFIEAKWHSNGIVRCISLKDPLVLEK